jgi:hypothetical protein
MVLSANKEAYLNRKNNSFEQPNPLHRFATYNSLFTLSGITEKELRDGSYLTNPVRNVVARSSGIGTERLDVDAGGVFGIQEQELIRNTKGSGGGAGLARDRISGYVDQFSDTLEVLRRNHDVFIENVNILSTISPNAERNLSNFTKMEFEIHEPYSITLIEKIRSATFLSGFLDYQDAPLLLTIEFRGFDENGKPLKNKLSEVRKVPILIARVEFDVNEGGARYSVVAVPYSDVPFDDRFKVLRSRVDLTVKSGMHDYERWKQKFEKAMDDQMKQEIEEGVRRYPDKYRIEVDDALLNSPELRKYAFTQQSLYAGATISDRDQYILQSNYDNYTVGPDYTQTADSGTTIPKALEDWMRHQVGFFDLAQDFWRAYLTMADYDLPQDNDQASKRIRELLTDKDQEQKLSGVLLTNQYVPWFKIKTTIYTDTSKLDPITKMHPKEIVYKAIPYKIHVLKLLSAGLSVGKVSWDKLVRKNYDFIYTGDNLDVQNLRIFYKSAYYMRNVRGDDKTQNETGFPKVVGTLSKLVFGEETYPEPTLPLRSYPSNIKSRSTVEKFKPGGNKAQEFFDYLTNPIADMMTIELDILGDPQFICQDVLSSLKRLGEKKTESIIKTVGDFDSQLGSFNADQFMTLINVRYRLPADIDEKKEGTMFSGTQKFRDENLFFNGVYQVVKVDSKFNQGQFTQTLTCVRMNNQQGQGLAPTVLTSSLNKHTGAVPDEEGPYTNETDQLGDVSDLG